MIILGMSPPELFTLMFIGLGPVRVGLGFISLARDEPSDVQREMARRTVLAGTAVALIIVLFGGLVVRNFAPSVALISMSGGLVLIATSLSSLARSRTNPSMDQGENLQAPMAAALTPLAVPIMIGPVGMSALFASAFVEEIDELMVFLVMVAVVMVLNFGTLRLVTRLAKRVTEPILRVTHEIMSLLLVAFGAQLLLEGLTAYGFVTIN